MPATINTESHLLTMNGELELKLLVLGQGGREHAIVKALALSPSVMQIHAIPGNDGMVRETIRHNIDWNDTEALVQFCLRNEIDVVIIGPEDPLVAGVADRLRERGILVFGPGGEAAQLEGSKIYSKAFMQDAGVPTAKFAIVDSVESVKKSLPDFTPPYVLKADGLAGGKGVFICKTVEELITAATDIFERETLGAAGKRALLEQFQPGWEMSYLVLTNGHDFRALPIAQDHKRLGNDDVGPNTGGMGTIAPVPVDKELLARIDREIVTPTVKTLERKGLTYRGVIFLGLMITEEGPTVLEYNVRFGDPETQVILPLVDGDWGKIFYETARGQMVDFGTKAMSACCVVLAADGYPENPRKGTTITGDVFAESTSQYFVHAGTKRDENDAWKVNGGRVLGAIGLGSTTQEAINNAYQLSHQVNWEGIRKRSDIGAKITKTSEGLQR